VGASPGDRIRVGYLVERYEPGGTLDDVVAAADRVAAATEQMARDGAAVSYLGTTYLPEEETVLDAFAAPSIELVRAASERARTPVARVARAVVVIPQKSQEEGGTCPSDTGRAR
jgi:hypothetical protein